MKLELVKYKCSNCAHEFESPALCDNAYGEFLLWSRGGSSAYLNAFKDKTYKEVDGILLNHPKTSTLNPVERAKMLQRIYGGLACDRDNNNLQFEIGAFPPCPTCGDQKMTSWEFQYPPKIVDVSLSLVTHIHWSGLSNSEKIKLTDISISAL
ncbi:MAG: hypothetical protein WCC64_13620 [Aliidongia sp.]